MIWFILYVILSGLIAYVAHLYEADTSKWSTSYLIVMFFVSMLQGWIAVPVGILMGFSRALNRRYK